MIGGGAVLASQSKLNIVAVELPPRLWWGLDVVQIIAVYRHESAELGVNLPAFTVSFTCADHEPGAAVDRWCGDRVTASERPERGERQAPEEQLEPGSGDEC